MNRTDDALPPVIPKIFLLVSTLQPRNAVGNDVLAMARILGGAGYATSIYAEQTHPECAHLASRPKVSASDWQDPNAILIYQCTTEWELGEHILSRCRNKVVVRYHNVTPPELFGDYAKLYSVNAVKGREATARLAAAPKSFVWGASRFNNQEFIAGGTPAGLCRVLPPVLSVEDLARTPIDAEVLGKFRDAAPIFLCVATFLPHKGHFRAVDVLAFYRQLSGEPARLILAGGSDPLFMRYVAEVREYARMLGLEDAVVLAPSVSAGVMRAYYQLASAFLCVSEHEGFCVPLVEAMMLRVPLVAWGTTAVADTCGDCGIVMGRFDARVFAEALLKCVREPQRKRAMAEKGRERFEEMFAEAPMREALLKLIGEVQAL